MSKPSLADPESVFSEAGLQLTSQTSSSWLGLSGDGSSPVQESNGSEDKNENNGHTVVQHGKTAETQKSLSVHKKKNSQSKSTRVQGKETKRSISPLLRTSQLTSDPVSSGVRSSSCIKASAAVSIKSEGSPKSYKDISQKVGLDSSGLKIHRDSISAPFLSSTRCSFSHEVGHVAQGSKVPRTSLPRTEEIDDNNKKSVSGATDLSLQVRTEQNRTSYSGSVTFDSREEMSGSSTTERAGLGHCNNMDVLTPSIKSLDSHETNSVTCKKACSLLNGSSEPNVGHFTGDQGVCHQSGVVMRRCLSCVPESSPQETTRSCRKTFSLNVKIDVHFDNERNTSATFPTFVCSPVTEYNACDKHVTSENKCDTFLSTNSSKCDTNFASEKARNNNEIADVVDFDAKEKLLEKSFATKSQSTANVPIVPARKRLSEPTVTEDNGRRTCSVRHPSRRFSESLTRSDTQVLVPDGPASVQDPTRVQNSWLAVAEKKPAKETEAIPTYKRRGLAVAKPPLISRSEKGFKESEQPPGSARSSMTTELKQDAVCLNSKVETEKKQTDNPATNGSLQGMVQTEKPKVIPRKSISGANILSKISNKENEIVHCESTDMLETGSQGEHLVLGTYKGNEINKGNTAVSSSIKTARQSRAVGNTGESPCHSSNSECKSNMTSDKSTGISARSVAYSGRQDTKTGCSDGVLANSFPTQKRLKISSTPDENDLINGDSDTKDLSRNFHEVSKEDTLFANRDITEARSQHEQHKREKTLKEKAATSNEAFEARFRRSSSVQEHSFEKRVRRSSLTSESNQERRVAVLFHETVSNSTKDKGSHGTDPVTGTEKLKEKKGAFLSEESDLHGNTTDSTQETRGEKTSIKTTPRPAGRSETSKGSGVLPRLDVQKEANKMIKDEVGRPDSLNGTKNDTNAEAASKKSVPNENKSNALSTDEGNRNEPCEVSDDSDYDNPWDNLDDAVKRASIRYNRRPSRIAAGDTKTLLLKSAEDLGRLLEEADKRRQLRQARNSCQISPENMDSLTIPFTRFSPHRHTVKGIVSQQPMSTSQSTEDILKVEVEAFPKLNLMAAIGENISSNKGVDIRRPMSLISKAKAKISSPETKKRKK